MRLSNDALLQMTWSELCAEHWGARAALYSVCYNAKLNMTCKLVQHPLKYDVFRLVDIQTHQKLQRCGVLLHCCRGTSSLSNSWKIAG